MRRLFYTAVQHQVLLRTLLVLVVMTAITMAVGTPGPALAGPDSFDP